ncbi:MAG: Fur family transcriptional regulator, ferric uptake regulator [Verrucomicrobiota bacterium]|jgi:Fe2+ or Zn2+ uptake regulation protein
MSAAHSHAQSPGEGLPELTERLRRKSRKVTAPRQAILAILRRHPHPLSIREIFGELGRGNCDLATVYRSMHLLENMGIVKRFHFEQGGARFELLDEGDDGHHHHLVCRSCDEVVEIEDCFPSELEKRIARRNGFKSVTHRLEFFGLCPRCQ